MEMATGERPTFTIFNEAMLQQQDAERNRVELPQLIERGRILRAVPGTALASDQPYRIADLAIDYAEDVGPLAAGVPGGVKPSGLTSVQRDALLSVNKYFNSVRTMTGEFELPTPWCKPLKPLFAKWSAA